MTDRTYLDHAMLGLEVAASGAHARGHKITVSKCRRALDLLHTENPGYRAHFPHIWNPADRDTYQEARA